MSDFKPLSPEDLFRLSADQIKKINALLVVYRDFLASDARIPWEKIAEVLQLDTQTTPNKNVTWLLSQTYEREGWIIKIFDRSRKFHIVFERAE